MEENIRSNNMKELEYSDILMQLLLGSDALKTKIVSKMNDKGFEWEVFKNLLKKNVIICRISNILKDLGGIDYGFLQEFSNMEKKRVQQGLNLIGSIDKQFEEKGIEYVVIKTLDNYPDQGHDIDIFVYEGFEKMERTIQNELGGKAKDRSLSDKLAGKTSYRIVGVPTLEVHFGVIGQIGEYRSFARDLIQNRKRVMINGIGAFVPSNEHQLFLTTLQRIYRHFNLRICDVINTITLLKSKEIDWNYINRKSVEYGMNQGIYLYLDFVNRLHYKLLNENVLPMNILEHFSASNNKLPLKFTRSYYRFPVWDVVPLVYRQKYVSDVKNLSFESTFKYFLLFPIIMITYINLKLFPNRDFWKKLW